MFNEINVMINCIRRKVKATTDSDTYLRSSYMDGLFLDFSLIVGNNLSITHWFSHAHSHGLCRMSISSISCQCSSKCSLIVVKLLLYKINCWGHQQNPHQRKRNRFMKNDFVGGIKWHTYTSNGWPLSLRTIFEFCKGIRMDFVEMAITATTKMLQCR